MPPMASRPELPFMPTDGKTAQLSRRRPLDTMANTELWGHCASPGESAATYSNLRNCQA